MERGGFTIANLFMPSVSLNSFALLLSSFLFYWIFYWHAFTPLFFLLCSFSAYFLCGYHGAYIEYLSY